MDVLKLILSQQGGQSTQNTEVSKKPLVKQLYGWIRAAKPTANVMHTFRIEMVDVDVVKLH